VYLLEIFLIMQTLSVLHDIARRVVGRDWRARGRFEGRMKGEEKM